MNVLSSPVNTFFGLNVHWNRKKNSKLQWYVHYPWGAVLSEHTVVSDGIIPSRRGNGLRLLWIDWWRWVLVNWQLTYGSKMENKKSKMEGILSSDTGRYHVFKPNIFKVHRIQTSSDQSIRSSGQNIFIVDMCHAVPQRLHCHYHVVYLICNLKGFLSPLLKQQFEF